MEQMQNLGKSLEILSHTAGTQVGTAVAHTSAKATSLAKKTKDYVEANPLQSVAIAAATGLVLGTLLILATRKKQV